MVKLPSPDSFASYARSVASIPRMSQQEEYAAAVKWRDNKDKDSAHALVVSNLYLVTKSVRDHAGYKMNQADLAQEGVVGLMKAVNKFDPDKGFRLATYAIHWIEAEIREFILKNFRMLSWGTSSLAKKLFFGYRKTISSLSDVGESRAIPSTAQIASYMDVPVESAEMIRSFFQGGDYSLSITSDEEDGFIDIEDTSLSNNQLALIDARDNSLAVAKIKSVINELSERDKFILKSRIISDTPKSLSDLSKELGVSIERVRQLEANAIKKVKEKFNF